MNERIGTDDMSRAEIERMWRHVMRPATCDCGEHQGVNRHGNTTSDRMERARRRHVRWVAQRRITCHGERARIFARDAWGVWVFCDHCQRFGRIQ